MLAVETEVNEDSKSRNEMGTSLVCSLGCRVDTRDFCSALTALVDPVQNICFLTWVKFSWLRSSRVWGDLTECMVRASDYQCQSRTLFSTYLFPSPSKLSRHP